MPGFLRLTRKSRGLILEPRLHLPNHHIFSEFRKHCKAGNHHCVNPLCLVNRGYQVRHDVNVLLRHEVDSSDYQIFSIVSRFVAGIEEVQTYKRLCLWSHLSGTKDGESPDLFIGTVSSFFICPYISNWFYVCMG